MRVAAWVFLVCTVLAASAAFLPSVEVHVGGVALGRRASLSLYQMTTNRDFVRRLIVGYHRSSGKRIGGALIAVLGPRASGKLGGVIGDARDAMDTLDGVSDDDAKTLGTVLMIAIWSFLALHAVMAALVFAETMREGWRRGRIIAATAIAVVATGFAIATYLVTTQAVWEANDEVGRPLLDLGAGAYLIPVAAVAGLGAMITLLILQIRNSRNRTRAPAS